VLQEVGDPFAVPHIGLPSRHRLDVAGVNEQEREAAFQQIPDRPPVDAGALERHMGAARSEQPVGQCQEIRRHGAEGAHLLTDPTIALGEQ
jgi:hypothetical protein